MAHYYKRRIQARSWIMDAIQENKGIFPVELHYNIGMKYGFAEKFVNDFLDQLEAMKKIKYNKEGGIVWQKQ